LVLGCGLGESDGGWRLGSGKTTASVRALWAGACTADSPKAEAWPHDRVGRGEPTPVPTTMAEEGVMSVFFWKDPVWYDRVVVNETDS
jgi:hypothetical protein